MKECNKCGESKELTKFYYREDRDAFENICRTCQSAATSALRSKPENVAKRKDQLRDSNLRLNYGINLKEYNVMYESQLGCCAICGIEEKHSSRQRLVVDHDHETLAVRSLLCGQCNVGLGHFKENQDFLANAIDYLKRFNT
tara:strand:+ start:75 stop:500 length:426 start_codon:yes stop_codon:yes gene_type:complete